MKINLSNHMQTMQNSDRSLEVQQKNSSNDSVQIIKDIEPDRNKVESAVTKMNDFIEPLVTNLKFVFHEDLHEYYVTVVNPLTDEVIREIPPKKMLDMYAAMTEYMGLLVDEKI